MESNVIVAIAITNALFQTVKQVDVKDRFNRLYPIAVLVLGFGVGLLFHFDVIASLIVGLSANGTYAVVKEPVKVGLTMVKGMLK